MFDPDAIYREREKASEELSKAVYNYHLLEEDKKSVLATYELEVEKENPGIPQTAIERRARASEGYREYIRGLVEAKRAYEKARAHYNNICALSDHRQTMEVSTRGLK